MFDIPWLPMIDGIVSVEGNYFSKGSCERGAFFRDSEGNMISLGQALP